MTANVHSMWKRGNLVHYDKTRQRWLDAIGGDVTKYILSTAALPVDDTTALPTEFTTTLVNTSTVALADNTLLFTCDNAENDGVNMQLTSEPFDFATGNLVYFGVSLQVNDADQVDILAGICILDTTLLGGMTDGVYFESLDESTDINLVLEKDSTETTSATAVGTLEDATDIILEFVFDGTYIDSWVNGVQQTRLATTNLPDDEQLTLSLAILTGEAIANTMTVNWCRAIQINA